jgi:hypothetical protein
MLSPNDNPRLPGNGKDEFSFVAEPKAIEPRQKRRDPKEQRKPIG